MTQEKTGVLYICATPIGNLEDMTYRAVRILQEVSVIAAEDTRHTRKLLSHFAIHTPLVSYHEHNKTEAGPRLIERIKNGETVAVVSDAGMPGISDPGQDLVLLAIEAGISVIPIPGPNAALCALVGSGLDTRVFTFIGFLPKTAKKRRELLQDLACHPYTLLFYETPHRIKATVAELLAAFGDRPAAAARELTKKFEEFRRGTLSSLTEHLQGQAPRGEYTLVVGGAADEADMAPEKPDQAAAGVSLADAVLALIAAGNNKKDAIRQVASERNLPKRIVYNALIGNDM